MTSNALAEILLETAKAIRALSADGTWGSWGDVPAEELAEHALRNEMSDIVSYILYDCYGYEAREFDDAKSSAYAIAVAATTIESLLASFLRARPQTTAMEVCQWLEEMAHGMVYIQPSCYATSANVNALTRARKNRR